MVGILAGGLGTRLAEETIIRPKPMVEIGGRPILWHIMKIYATHGHRDFAVALGYKGEMIKDYFLHYRERSSSLTIDLRRGAVTMDDDQSEDWRVILLDTGVQTETGGRVRRLLARARGEPILMTYGDGVADIDINALIRFHREQGRLATVTAVRPPSRFGEIRLAGDRVSFFDEKPQIGEGWINGGFFVLEPGVAEYIRHDGLVFEKEPMERLARDGQLAAYRHEGFWQCMDTMRDVRLLEELWSTGKAPWKVWK